MADIEMKSKTIKPVKNATPSSWGKNELLAMHGSNGFLITRLSRYAITGWLAFFLSMSLFFVYVAFDKLVPVPVIAVNGSGQILGTFEYLDPTTRTDEEVIAASKYFLDRYTSVNGSTVFEDNAIALTMMVPKLRERTLESLKETQYLLKAEKARAHSFNEYDKNDGARIIAKRDLLRAVRLKGYLVITPRVGGDVIEKPFDITLDIKIIPRNTFVTAGISVVEIRNN